MRIEDIKRKDNINSNTKDRLDSYTTSIPVKEGESSAIPKSGTCLVQSSVTYGVKGSCCDVEVLSNGAGTGINIKNAICYNAKLNIGDKVAFTKRRGGNVELTAGSSSSGDNGGNTTTIISAILPAGWCVTGS